MIASEFAVQTFGPLLFGVFGCLLLMPVLHGLLIVARSVVRAVR